MAPRAFITGLSGPALTADERAFLREARPWGLILFKRNIEDKAQVIESCSRSFAVNCGARCARPGRPGGRPGAAARAAALAGLSARRGLWPRSTTRDARAGLAAARLGARLIAADLARARHQRRLPAAGRRAGRRRRRGDRRPRLRRHAGQVAALAAARGRGPDGRRRAAGAQAHPRPRPRHRRQPSNSCRWWTPTAPRSRRPTSPRSGRLQRLPLGMTAHVVFTRHRPGAPGHDFGHNDRRSDSRLHRFRRAFDERRRVDGSLVRFARRAHAAPRSRPAATWCFIATASSTRCGRSRPKRRSSPARPARRAGCCARAARKPPPAIDLAAARREFAAMMA